MHYVRGSQPFGVLHQYVKKLSHFYLWNTGLETGFSPLPSPPLRNAFLAKCPKYYALA